MCEEVKIQGLWYLVDSRDSRECKLGEVISSNENEEGLPVYKSMAIALLKHDEYRNSHVYEVSIEDEADEKSSISRGVDAEFDEEEAINFLESIIFPEKGNQLEGFLERFIDEQISGIGHFTIEGYKVKKVRVHREILSVCYVAVEENHGDNHYITLKDCYMNKPFPSLKKLLASLMNNPYNGFVYKVCLGNILKLYRELDKKCSEKINDKIDDMIDEGALDSREITPNQILDELDLDEFNLESKEIQMNLGEFDIYDFEDSTETLVDSNIPNDSELYLRDVPNDA